MRLPSPIDTLKDKCFHQVCLIKECTIIINLFYCYNYMWGIHVILYGVNFVNENISIINYKNGQREKEKKKGYCTIKYPI